jgi:hypothetical protein
MKGKSEWANILKMCVWPSRVSTFMVLEVERRPAGLSSMPPTNVGFCGGLWLACLRLSFRYICLSDWTNLEWTFEPG